MTGPATDGWQELTRLATVALEVPADGPAGPRRGTGFIVAPGVVATCAHVLAEAAAPLPEHIEGRLVALGRDLRLTCDRKRYFRDAAGLDLALLHVEDDGGAAPVLLSPVMRLGDEMWTFGHPDTRFRAGQPATFTFQGASRRSTDQVFELPRVHGVPVGPGFSGSPVVNPRTGAVCGMLSTSDDRGSAHLISAAEILTRCPESRHPDGFPPSDRRWLSTLTDEQIRSGGWSFPGPRLRAYLSAASRAATDHPYPGVVPGTRPPPLAAVYVRQRARPAGGTDAEDDAGARGTAIPAKAVMELEHDCLVIAGPGGASPACSATA